MPDDYSSAGGALRLKGVQGGKIDKKKKRKKKAKAIEDGSADGAKERSEVEAGSAGEEGEKEGPVKRKKKEEPIIVGKTEAEKRFEEMREKRLLERLKREGVKTHKERVEEFNKYLSGLSEHHDMPRIGPG